MSRKKRTSISDKIATSERRKANSRKKELRAHGFSNFENLSDFKINSIIKTPRAVGKAVEDAIRTRGYGKNGLLGQLEGEGITLPAPVKEAANQRKEERERYVLTLFLFGDFKSKYL